MGYPLRVMAALAQPLGQSSQQLRGILGNRLARAVGLEPIRIGKGPSQPLPLFGVAQVIQGQAMDLDDRVGEMGMNLDGAEVADDQQRRVVQGGRVLLQLPQGRAQVLVLALILPGETVLAPDIGPAVAPAGLLHPLLEAEPLALRIGDGRRRDAQQIAKLVEVGLGGGAFGQGAIAPCGDERVELFGGGLVAQSGSLRVVAISLQEIRVKFFASCKFL